MRVAQLCLRRSELRARFSISHGAALRRNRTTPASPAAAGRADPIARVHMPPQLDIVIVGADLEAAQVLFDELALGMGTQLAQLSDSGLLGSGRLGSMRDGAAKQLKLECARAGARSGDVRAHRGRVGRPGDLRV